MEIFLGDLLIRLEEIDGIWCLVENVAIKLQLFLGEPLIFRQPWNAWLKCKGASHLVNSLLKGYKKRIQIFFQ